MQETADLHFVLSSVDRLVLLSELRAHNLRLTQLAQKITGSVQETWKHLARLKNAQLVEKDSEGAYGLTAFGRLVFDAQPTFRFLAEQRDYFCSHEISSLPQEFVRRIGELAEHRVETHVGGVLSYCQDLITEATEYLWFMGDEPLFRKRIGNIPLLHSLPENVMIRCMLAAAIGEGKARRAKSLLGPRVELRLADDVRVATGLNERMAIILFADRNGKLDFNRAFTGTSTIFHRWCYDLFTCYWVRSSPLRN